MALYEKEIILKKDYSFLIIDKSAKHSKRLWKCDKGKTLYAIWLDGSSWGEEEESPDDSM